MEGRVLQLQVRDQIRRVRDLLRRHALQVVAVRDLVLPSRHLLQSSGPVAGPQAPAVPGQGLLEVAYRGVQRRNGVDVLMSIGSFCCAWMPSLSRIERKGPENSEP